MLSDNDYIQTRLSTILIEIGTPVNLQGYKFLKDAVCFVLDDNGLINCVTKKLYPLVAKKQGVSAAVVERSIRHCVDCAISRKGVRGINSVFKCEVYNPYYKPSNSELIALLAEKLIAELLERKADEEILPTTDEESEKNLNKISKNA